MGPKTNFLSAEIFSSDQMFDHNPESKEDIHLAHIELPITSPKTLTDPRAAIVFQPMARASPARTKTNRRPVDRLELGVIFFFAQCVPNGCLLRIPGYN